MSDYIVRIFQVQLLSGSADVPMTDVTADQAAEIVLTAVEGDPDDETGERRYHLPDGRFIPLDPEDCVVGGRIYCQVLDGEHRLVGLYGDLAPCDVTEGTPEARVGADLRALLADLRLAAESHHKVGGSFPLGGIGSLFDHLDRLDAVATAGPRLTTEEAEMVRAVLNGEIMATGSNTKAILLTSALGKLPRH
ncbi:hypothetical protein [Roseomonas gilardii]|uniref:hypothetical protein n=1 Tax=Roseomonas gilardii TaxID=257708 RepID=UPI0011A502C6|nr:hypothetical protein [Roseomonas gilardii]